MSWARVDDGLWEHPKFEALREGQEYAAGFLWVLAISHAGRKQNPRITILEAMMLLACDRETAEKACATLAEVGLFDVIEVEKPLKQSSSRGEVCLRFASKQSSSYAIHDWKHYRSKHEAKAIAGRKGGKKSAESRRAGNEAKSKQGSSRPQAETKQTSTPRNPSPSPSPSPSPLTNGGENRFDRMVKPVEIQTRQVVIADIVAVFEHWRGLHPDEYLQPHSGLSEWRDIERRMTQDACTVEILCKAIDGIHLDDWEGRARNLELRHVVKSLASVQRFAAMQGGGSKTAEQRKAEEQEEARKRIEAEIKQDFREMGHDVK